MDYVPLSALATPSAPRPRASRSSDAVYFRRFTQSTFVREYAPVHSISFVPSPPSSSAAGGAATSSTSGHRLAVSAGARVQIYNAKSRKVVKTISRFGDVARGANWRNDGRLLVAGDDSGLVQVFDISSRAILRTLKGHKLPVHVSRFSSDPSQILTASDDTTLRLWDLPTETALSTYTGHSDYVRSALVSPDKASLFLSGSYDGTVRLWDTRLPAHEAGVMTMRHGAPVEDTLIYPTGGGGVAVSAGGPTLRVWDLMMGGRCLRATSNHAKTITALALSTSDAEGSGAHALRLLSAGLDGLVKVYDPARDYAVTHTMRYPSPLLSIALSADEQHIATGGADGTLCIRSRALRANEAAARVEAQKAKEQGTSELFLAASASASGAQATMEAPTVRTKRLAPFDAALKAFRYADALDLALRQGTNKQATFALLTELGRRSSADGKEDGLRRAVAGRDEGALEPLLRFLLRHAGNPQHNDVVCRVAEVVIDTYASILGQSPLIDDLFGRLWAKVNDEIRLQREVQKVRGALEMLVVRGTA